MPDHWTATTENGTSVSVKGHLHLYRDAMLAQMLANELHRDVRDVLDIKNEDANAIRRFTEEMAREVADIRKKDGEAVAEKFRDCHEFCVHGIIGARYTGTPHEHDYQETNLS